MIFRSPNPEIETLDEALARVDREIFTEEERENFKNEIKKLYVREVNENVTMDRKTRSNKKEQRGGGTDTELEA